jgi:NAD(P)-dependent dehydrogenase (short-subunit alcohol dehydrogenase family)
MTPAFHYGLEWGYTFDDFEKDCNLIRGQTALITGANSGTGFAIAKNLAKCGVKITLACRNEQRCDTAADKIKDVAHPETILDIGIVNTSSLSSVRSFSLEFLQRLGDNPLDMLFLNAGRGIIMNPESESSIVLSVDGVESFFATNYLGHHLMWKYLSPAVQRSKLGRVVQTSSASSYDTFDHKVATNMDLLQNEPNLPKSTDMKWYGQSKLAQIVWCKKLARVLGRGSNVRVNAAHPGAVGK